MPYGAVPGIFKKFNAALIAADAYTREEGEPWTVMIKTTDSGATWFSPIREEDIERAKTDDWDEVGKHMSRMIHEFLYERPSWNRTW